MTNQTELEILKAEVQQLKEEKLKLLEKNQELLGEVKALKSVKSDNQAKDEQLANMKNELITIKTAKAKNNFFSESGALAEHEKYFFMELESSLGIKFGLDENDNPIFTNADGSPLLRAKKDAGESDVIMSPFDAIDCQQLKMKMMDQFNHFFPKPQGTGALGSGRVCESKKPEAAAPAIRKFGIR